MEAWTGVNGSVHKGVLFTEETIPDARVLRHLRVQISRQNSNLGEVKDRLARKAKKRGATAVMNFRYGQKRNPWWQLFFTLRFDTESWHGEGDAIQL
jgi:hypothetical protein